MSVYIHGVINAKSAVYFFFQKCSMLYYISQPFSNTEYCDDHFVFILHAVSSTMDYCNLQLGLETQPPPLKHSSSFLVS